jgi:hypothetical protein
VVAQQARILDDGAKATTTRIRRDHRNGIEPHEETLTQNFVSDYVARVRRAKLRARANEFTKRQEAQLFGADVALWFVNAAGQFAGIYLQAKVLRRDDSYRGLNRSNRWGPQHQTLIDAGTRDGSSPGTPSTTGSAARSLPPRFADTETGRRTSTASISRVRTRWRRTSSTASSGPTWRRCVRRSVALSGIGVAGAAEALLLVLDQVMAVRLAPEMVRVLLFRISPLLSWGLHVRGSNRGPD